MGSGVSDTKSEDLTPPHDKIVGKLRQLDHQPGAIAIWNDDEVLDDLHCRTAVHRLQTDLRLGRVTSASEAELVLYSPTGSPVIAPTSMPGRSRATPPPGFLGGRTVLIVRAHATRLGLL
jgi:hypothetical protein